MPNWDSHKASDSKLFVIWKLRRQAVTIVDSNLLVPRFSLAECLVRDSEKRGCTIAGDSKKGSGQCHKHFSDWGLNPRPCPQLLENEFKGPETSVEATLFLEIAAFEFASLLLLINTLILA
jgi:hypothetical protein